LKIVAIIAEDSFVRTSIAVGLHNHPDVEFQYYTPDSLDSVILDSQISVAIYITEKVDQEIEKIATIVPPLILIADKNVWMLPMLFVPIDCFARLDEAMRWMQEIRLLIDPTDYGAVLLGLTSRQRAILEAYCSLLSEKEAIEKIGVCKRTYNGALQELKKIFNLPDIKALRQLFCSSKL
jgi:hypothetical protein